MLRCVGFRRGTVTTHRELGWSAVQFLSFLNTVVTAPDMLEPLELSVVGPRVKNGDTEAGLSFRGHLLGALFIFNLESRQLAQLFESILHVLLNQVVSTAHQFPFFILTTNNKSLLVVFQSPKPSLTKNLGQIDFKSSEEILVIKVNYVF